MGREEEKEVEQPPLGDQQIRASSRTPDPVTPITADTALDPVTMAFPQTPHPRKRVRWNCYTGGLVPHAASPAQCGSRYGPGSPPEWSISGDSDSASMELEDYITEEEMGLIHIKDFCSDTLTMISSWRTPPEDKYTRGVLEGKAELEMQTTMLTTREVLEEPS